MQGSGDFFTWLFNDKTGVICLIAGGIVVCLVIALVMERTTKRRYFNHEKDPDDEGWGLFGDDEDDEDADA